MRWTWDEQDLWIDPSQLVAARTTKFEGTAGDDRLIGTAERDRFDVSQGGDDELHGRGGRDEFDFGSAFTRDDVVYGGDDRDIMVLAGDYSSTITLDAGQIRQVEKVVLDGDRQYNVQIEDGFSFIQVNAHRANAVELDASKLQTGSLKLFGGLHADILVGGAGDDWIIGSANVSSTGSELLTGGAGADHFVYTNSSDSPGNAALGRPDLITDFERGDVIVLPRNETQVYHVGNAAGRAGEIDISYDSQLNQTKLSIFTNADDKADMVILLTGEYDTLAVRHQHHLVIE